MTKQDLAEQLGSTDVPAMSPRRKTRRRDDAENLTAQDTVRQLPGRRYGPLAMCSYDRLAQDGEHLANTYASTRVRSWDRSLFVHNAPRQARTPDFEMVSRSNQLSYGSVL